MRKCASPFEIIWATDQCSVTGQATSAGQCPGAATCSAQGSGWAGRPGPGGAPEDLPPREQSLLSGSLSVCWVAGLEIHPDRIAFCLFPEDNEQGGAFPTLEFRDYFFLRCLHPLSGPFSRPGFLVNLLWTFRLPICWVSGWPREGKGYCYFCSLTVSDL